jgi:coenzyme Q-binding protein COQ10
MARVETSKLVGFPWSDLFHLVLDLKSYPQFVPHCRDVRLLSQRTGERTITIVSRMTVGFAAIEVGYANRTTADIACRQIRVEALDGPLQYLHALWSFDQRDHDRTLLRFSVEYEFSNPLLAAVASRAFAAMFGDIVGAFEQRAASLFAERVSPGRTPADLDTARLSPA